MMDLTIEINGLADRIYRANKAKGFWDGSRSEGEIIALIHSELSELLEVYRSGNSISAKIPQFSSEEEEVADAIIRLLDLAGARQLDIGGAIEAKLAYNATRPHKHGKQF